MKTMFDAFEEHYIKKVGDVKGDDPCLEFIEINIPMNIGFWGNMGIVDIETTGIVPGKNKIVTLGCIHHEYLTIIQRANCTKERFEEVLKDYLEMIYRVDVYDLYAYNCSFERNFLTAKQEWKEIMPYRIKKDECVAFAHFGFGEGKDVPAWWHKFEKTHDLQYLHDIMKHNMNCLLKELAIFSVNYSNCTED